MEISIKKIRERGHLSQVELAILMGVHFTTVSRWERGKIFPTPHQSMVLELIQKNAKRFKEAKRNISVKGPIETLKELLH